LTFFDLIWDPQVNKGTEAALIQLLETGVMHADPHPGNILLGRDGQLQFIDFGLITHMEKKHQGAMLAAIAHLVNGDWQSLTEDLADMDVVKPTTDRFAVRLVRRNRSFFDTVSMFWALCISNLVEFLPSR